jgi:hypothetical protein
VFALFSPAAPERVRCESQAEDKEWQDQFFQGLYAKLCFL